ncbi:ABC-F family ATP-binding cassette domain-containing protein [Arthrobacter sp. CAN_C5]|uniref:ABC-F family ATP-binding cassette domain-containing protein n=1 Tax=Arthrobacter sp. CAN_C5 TaxID=2760706 RepID=UPI001AE3065D|nr:ABC-F family ATP-binding cassette domain-containing protein [Arthrobacter sp. CAN_C5]MBP2215521.1 macrolide transport system ATP-binding/permease protein [Arthrobacter sp. CAN_C5]
MSEHIELSEVSHGYGDRLLLDHVNLRIGSGERVAVVGENGAGKSTLLRLIAGLESPDGGQVSVHGAVGHLPQTLDHAPTDTVQTVIDTALARIRSIEAELRTREAALAVADSDELERYGAAQSAYDLHDGYAVDSRVDAALSQLRLGGLQRNRTLDTLSGGEQERLALACLLADPAAILLLDEPTNHLDDNAVAWLERELAAHRGAVVAISHDRSFLRTFATTIIEVDGDRRELRRYGDGYNGYLQAKAAERRRWEQDYQQWMDAKEAERAKAAAVEGRMGYGRRRDGDKMGYDFKQGTVQEAITSQKRNALERLRRLQEHPVDRPPQPLTLSAQFGGQSLTGTVLELDGAAVADRLAVEALAVGAGDNLLVTGPNGAGKTTLLEVMAGVCPVDRGTLAQRGHLGYLPQELRPHRKPSMRLLPAFASGLIGDLEEHADRLLNLGLFRTADLLVPVGSLSAGQYRRLALARLLVGRYDVILFDEPTNHLAPVLVGELEEALAGYGGTLVIASHDRELRRWFSTLPTGRELRLESGRVAGSPS